MPQRLFNSVAHLPLPFCSQLCIFLLFCYYSLRDMAAGLATMYVCPQLLSFCVLNYASLFFRLQLRVFYFP